MLNVLNLMHAGENFFENTLRMMDGYPNPYADLRVEFWLHPVTKDYGTKFLKSAKEYGFLYRVLFGSDQMVWPEAFSSSIDFLNSIDFLKKSMGCAYGRHVFQRRTCKGH